MMYIYCIIYTDPSNFIQIDYAKKMLIEFEETLFESVQGYCLPTLKTH